MSKRFREAENFRGKLHPLTALKQICVPVRLLFGMLVILHCIVAKIYLIGDQLVGVDMHSYQHGLIIAIYIDAVTSAIMY